MRASLLLVLLIVTTPLAGCLGPREEPLRQNDAPESLTPWERGLSDTAETPAMAVERSRDVRRGDVAPPGAPQYTAFDAVMLDFMASHEIPAASVAVLRDGFLQYENGYGFLDRDASAPTPPDALFRVASITKPLTAAVIAMLVEQGLMAWDDPVFCLPPEPASGCLLPITPHPKRPVVDDRLADVTLRHLVEHRTGWTRGPCTAPYFEHVVEIAELFEIPSPPPAWRLAQWFMGTPMEFDPGTDPGPEFDTYCNAGYSVLGLIAEAATGATMEALYEAYLFKPLQVAGDIEPGHTRPEERNPREPAYVCDYGRTESIYPPHNQVCWADGGFDLDALLPVGGIISTAAAIGAIYEVYANDGSVRGDGLLEASGHSGGLPGTATGSHRYRDTRGGVVSDVQIVVFFNKATGHELALFDLGAPYEYQKLYAALAAAYAGAEARLPV